MRNYNGCWVRPNGTILVLGPDDAFDHVLEDDFPELDKLWEEEWEPNDLEYPEEAIEYAFDKGWIMVFDRKRSDGGTSTEVTAKLHPTPEALEKLRSILNPENVLYLDGPKQKSETRMVDVTSLLMGLLK